MKETCQGSVPGPEGNWGDGLSPSPELPSDKMLSIGLQPRGSLSFGGICFTTQALKIGSFLLFFSDYILKRGFAEAGEIITAAQARHIIS